MKARELRRILKSLGCAEVRQKGSHLRIECGSCATTVPVHSGEDLGPGLLRHIERDLEPCLGKGWIEEVMTTYHVSYERDESGWWVASVREVRGCHTQGRTVDEARRRVLEALELFVVDVRPANVVDDVKLPAAAVKAIKAYHRLRN